MTHLNDLPVSWDGIPITWRGWNAAVVFLCGRGKAKRSACCGSLDMPATNIGLTRETTPAGIRRESYRLMAFRCQGCGHDQVLDHETGELWDLDETDYGTAGSEITEPELF